MEFKRKDPKEIGKITLEDNRRTWKIYDCPVELIKQYIAYARIHFDNQVWKVLEKGMKLILEKDKECKEWRDDIERRVRELEKKIALLTVKEEKEEVPATFGGSTFQKNDKFVAYGELTSEVEKK